MRQRHQACGVLKCQSAKCTYGNGRGRACDNVQKLFKNTDHVAERASTNEHELAEHINEDIHIQIMHYALMVAISVLSRRTTDKEPEASPDSSLFYCYIRA